MIPWSSGGWFSEPQLCGDGQLTGRQRRRYLLYGLKQIIRSAGCRVRAEPLALEVNTALKASLRNAPSPLRVYTRAILEHASAHVGPKGTVCDIGCGSGGQSRFFADRATTHSYLGIDVEGHSSWRLLSGNRDGLTKRFLQASVVNLGIREESVCFSYSSSALEHVDDVESAARELSRTLQKGSFSLHIVPGPWSLFLFLFHGYRRFSAESLTNLFEGAGLEIVRLWALGGLGSFAMHAVWITCLQTGLVWDWFAAGARRGVAGFSPRIGERMRGARMLPIYCWFLWLALKVDRRLRFPATGYAVLVKRPTI